MRFGLAEKIIAMLLLWRRVATQRAELSRMSDELLKDIGISRADAIREAKRHFWDTAPTEIDVCKDQNPVMRKDKYN